MTRVGTGVLKCSFGVMAVALSQVTELTVRFYHNCDLLHGCSSSWVVINGYRF